MTYHAFVAWADVALSVASLALLVYLLVTYVRLYRALRQRFTLGLVIFTVLLLVNNLSGTLFHVRQFAGPGGRRVPHGGLGGGMEVDPAFVFLRLIPNLFELVAIAVLVALARE